MTVEWTTVKSPVGELVLAARAGKLCGLAFARHRGQLRQDLKRRFGAVTMTPARDPAGAVTALRAYFAGRTGALDRIRVDAGGTPFQRRVWSALRRIPSGRTISYAALAARIGHPRAVRAVGTANGRNPVAIVVPCHRVVATGGGLGGYGGGLAKKRWLLQHEGSGRG